MQLDDKTANAVITRPTADAAGAQRWFRARDLGGGITGTTMEEDYLNDMLGNIIALLAAGSITRTKGASGDSDMADAVKAIVGVNSPQDTLSGQLFRVSNSVYEMRPSNGADVIVGIDNKILKTTGNLTWDMALDLDGSENASEALYLYVRDNAGVLDEQISATVPDLPGGTKPGFKSGDATRRCVGSTWNDVGQDLVAAIHGPGGEVRFSNLDADHQLSPDATSSASWKTQAVNLPISAAHMLLGVHGETPSLGGLLGFAVGDATGAVTSNANRISAMGTSGPFCLYATVWDSGGDINGFGLAEMAIPVTVPGSPQFSYAITRTLSGTLEVNVLGYRDIFAPR